MKMTENEIQGLKAQEAKDVAIRLLKMLDRKEKAPLSAGEVQLKELEYELKLKEAESEDNRHREAHEQRMKELELQIEQEKARQAEAESNTQQVREQHAKLVEQVQSATESLSVQLEMASREHNLKIERLESEFTAKAEELKSEREQMKQERETLLSEIGELAELKDTAAEIGRLRENIESRQTADQQKLQHLDEEFAEAEFDKTKKRNEVRRHQELELAELETQHKKDLLQMNRQAAEDILDSLGMMAVEKTAWEQMKGEAQQGHEQKEKELDEIREKAEEAVRKTYHISGSEIIDVTDLYYRHQAVSREAESLSAQVEKLHAEVRRMREHIEREPQRIAATVEAAKVQVQNTIEQGGNR